MKQFLGARWRAKLRMLSGSSIFHNPFRKRFHRAHSSLNVSRTITQFIHLGALVTTLFGVIVLIGWVLNVPVLKSVLPGAVEMKANTAVGLMMAGSALYFISAVGASPLRQDWVKFVLLGLAVSLLGLATLGEYQFGWELGIDELLFRDTAGSYNVIRGRMSPYTAVAFASIGLALAAFPRPRLRILAGIGATVTTGIGALALLGYLWNASELVTDRWLPPVAVNTAVALILLGGGTLLAIFQSITRQARSPFALASVEVKVLTGFIAAVVLLAVSGGVTYRTITQSTDTAQWVSHTHEVRLALAHLYGDISDAESAQRNYLITGQASQLNDFRRLIASVFDQHEAVRRLVIDNPDQVQNLVGLRLLINRVDDMLRRGISLYQQQGFASARDLVGTGEGFRTMEAISTAIRHMGDVEKRLLVDRESAYANTRHRTLASLLLTLMVSTLGFMALFYGVRREMASRNAVEQALLTAKEEADSANRAKGTFLATMSHEIRTPMNGVLGMLELLALSKLEAAQRTTLEIVHESGKSLLRIIDDILDFSKIEAGRLEVRPEAASIKDVIEGVHNIYSGNASSKGIVIKRSADPRISPALLVDPLRLRQILNNLVSNALKFTSQGYIEVKAELIERVGDEDTVRFTVKDTGIGISAENQKRLFQPFSQAEGDTAIRFGGTGLGLTICKRLADMMGGSIEMVSEVGKGTTMILTMSLPIADPEHLPQADAQRTQAILSTPTGLRRMPPSIAQAESEGTLVLVVDDHPTNRLVLLSQLKTLGYATEYAENGIEALGKWRSGRFAIVITDCNMPEMDGYELTRSIRALESANGSRHTPILAWTANALGGDAEKCLAVGMDDYIAKPVQLPKLLTKLDQWLPIPVAAVPPAEASSTHSGTGGPIDRSVLAEISGGHAAAERDILLNFRRVNDEDSAMLVRAVANSEIPEITRATHRIKGACRTIGAIVLATICEDIEHASHAGDWAMVKSTMTAFHQELGRFNTYVDSL